MPQPPASVQPCVCDRKQLTPFCVQHVCKICAEFGIESPSSYGVLDSVVLNQPESASPAELLASAGPAAPAAFGVTHPTAVADMNWVTASMSVQAAQAAGDAAAPAVSSGGSSMGAVVNVVTEAGRWFEFYQGIANILLGVPEQEQQQTASGETAGAEVAGVAAGGELNNMLAVQPEQAAEVIRLIEAATKSSKEGRTIRLV